MEQIDQGKVNDAIYECLDRCYRKDAALAELALFLDELRSAEGWRQREIHEVELALLALLNGVLVASGTSDAHMKSVEEEWRPPNRPR